jgi:hypothetical protein
VSTVNLLTAASWSICFRFWLIYNLLFCIKLYRLTELLIVLKEIDWMVIGWGWISIYFLEFDCGGRSLKKIGRENFWRPGNYRAMDSSTTCRLTGDRKMRAASILALHEMKGAWIAWWTLRRIPPRLTMKMEQYSATPSVFAPGIPQDWR